MLRPDIYYCRSRNMEHFNCWWRPLGNLTEEEVTYTLTYSVEYVLHASIPDPWILVLVFLLFLLPNGSRLIRFMSLSGLFHLIEA